MRFSVLSCILLWTGLSFGAVPHRSFTRSMSSTVSGTPTPTQPTSQSIFQTPVSKLPGASPFKNGTIACRAASPDVKRYKQGDTDVWMKQSNVESLLDYTCKYPAAANLDGKDHYEFPATMIWTVGLGKEQSKVLYKVRMGWNNKPGCALYKSDLRDVEKCKKLWMTYVNKCDSEIPGEYTNFGGSYEDACLEYKFWAQPEER